MESMPHLMEIDSPAEIKRRNLLLIKIRWVIVGIFCIYGVMTGLLYHFLGNFSQIRSDFIIFSLIIAAVIGYNTLYHLYFSRCDFVSGLSQAQIFFDLIVASVMVYFCGGILSWVWGMMALLIVEAAFIFDNSRDTWIITTFSILFHGASLAGDFHHAYDIKEYSLRSLYAAPPEVILKVNYWLWLSFLDIGIAFVSTYLVKIVRSQEKFIRHNLMCDRLTGQYSRDYFFHRLTSEIERARRYDIFVSILLLDIDDMDEYNINFGQRKGDELIKRLALLIRNNIRLSDKPPTYEVDTLYRYYGDTFAILITEPIKYEKKAEIKPSPMYHTNKVRVMGDRLRQIVEQAKLGISVSGGISTLSVHSGTSYEMVAIAEKALYQAKKEGKNRILIGEWYGQPQLKVL